MNKRAKILGRLATSLILLLIPSGPVLAGPRHHQLFVCGHMRQPDTRRKAINILQNWVMRADALKLTPSMVTVRLVDLDTPADQATATKLGMQTGTGLSLGLVTLDDKGLPDKLEDQAGPFDTDMSLYFRNPELGQLVDAVSTLLGKVVEAEGRKMPYVGLYVVDASRMTVEELAMYQAVKDGAVVFHVTPESAAQKAGLKAGDEVLAVDDRPTPVAGEYWRVINAKAVGAALKIKFRRAGKAGTATFKVGAWP